MTPQSSADLARELEELSRRLESRIREFTTSGQLSSVDNSTREIREHEAKLKGKVDEALRKGTAWEIIKAEFMRDYETLFDNFTRWEARLDAGLSKDRKP
jgi:hypothetical protein